MNVPHHRLLTAAEEVALSRRVHAGLAAQAEGGPLEVVADGRAAEAELMACNQRLAAQHALKAARRWGIDPEAMMSYAQEGLLVAVRRFDPARGVRFSTYATPWIKQRLREGGRAESCAIHIPAHVHDERVRRLTGKPPDRSKDYMVAAADRARTVGSLDGTVADRRAPSEPTDWLPRLLATVKCLPPREQAIVRARYLSDRPEARREIGSRLGLSKERVRQIEERALWRLRQIIEAKSA